jgi:hypothetical protein
MPPRESSYYLTRMKFKDMDLTGLHLLWPSFVESQFENVNFEGSDLRNSSFAESQIERAYFTNVRLQFSQFGKARLESTSFVGADLYRSTFDKAQLSDVDFAQADLDKASFRAITYDRNTRFKLRNTAWWLAFGWSSGQIEELTRLQPNEQALRESRAFIAEKTDIEEKLQRAAPRSRERALALYRLALANDKWGIDVYGTGREPNPAFVADPELESDDHARKQREEFCREARGSTEIPKTARNAARQAMCLWDDEIPVKLHEVQALLGYILLQMDQTDQLREAVRHLNDAISKLEQEKPQKGLLAREGQLIFWYAAANYALWRNEKVGSKEQAFKDLERSLATGFIPDHELQHLSEVLRDPDGKPGEFLGRIYCALDERPPAPQLVQPQPRSGPCK